MVGGVGPAGAARVGAETPGSVAGSVVEQIIAVDGSASAKPNSAVCAKFLSDCHEHVGDHLVVEARRHRCPMHVWTDAAMVDDGRSDGKRGELGVDHGGRDRGLKIRQLGDQRRQFAHALHEPLDGGLRCIAGSAEPTVSQDLPGVEVWRLELVNVAERDFEGELDLGLFG